MTLKRNQKGFTIVELLIVIVVIGILAALVITTFTGIQQKARDTDRENDIRILHTSLEAYFATSTKYPTLGNLNDATWRSTNMKGLDADTLKDPRGSASALVAAPGSNVYSYTVTPSGCDNSTTGGDCTAYTLTATKESGGTVVKTSLN